MQWRALESRRAQCRVPVFRRASVSSVGSRLAVASAAVVSLVLCGTAAGQTARISQHIFDARGNPSLVADGDEIVQWRACRPGEACERLETRQRTESFLEPGPVPAGTVFEVDVRSTQGRVATARSRAWRGRVTATGAPGLAGALRVGRIIRPVATRWAGGWGDDLSSLRLEACRRRDARRCETLSSDAYEELSCAGGAAVLGRRYRGWWVRALDVRYARETAFADIGYGDARSIPLARPRRTVARTPLVGPVRRAKTPFSQCGRPRVTIFKGPLRRSGRLSVALIRCRGSCDAVIEIRDARRTIRRRFDPATSPTFGSLRVRRPLRGSTATIRVLVNGRHRAKRVVRLR